MNSNVKEKAPTAGTAQGTCLCKQLTRELSCLLILWVLCNVVKARFELTFRALLRYKVQGDGGAGLNRAPEKSCCRHVEQTPSIAAPSQGWEHSQKKIRRHSKPGIVVWKEKLWGTVGYAQGTQIYGHRSNACSWIPVRLPSSWVCWSWTHTAARPWCTKPSSPPLIATKMPRRVLPNSAPAGQENTLLYWGNPKLNHEAALS